MLVTAVDTVEVWEVVEVEVGVGLVVVVVMQRRLTVVGVVVCNSPVVDMAEDINTLVSLPFFLLAVLSETSRLTSDTHIQ